MKGIPEMRNTYWQKACLYSKCSNTLITLVCMKGGVLTLKGKTNEFIMS